MEKASDGIIKDRAWWIDKKAQAFALLDTGLTPTQVQDLVCVPRMTICGWDFKRRHPDYEKNRVKRIRVAKPVYLSAEWYAEQPGVWWR